MKSVKEFTKPQMWFKTVVIECDYISKKFLISR